MGTGYMDFFPFFLPGTNKADLAKCYCSRKWVRRFELLRLNSVTFILIRASWKSGCLRMFWLKFWRHFMPMASRT